MNTNTTLVILFMFRGGFDDVGTYQLGTIDLPFAILATRTY